MTITALGFKRRSKAIQGPIWFRICKSRALATRQVSMSKVVWHPALTTSAIFLVILYNEHKCWWCMGAFWSRVRSRAERLTYWYSSVHYGWGAVFCWSWMSVKVRASMAYCLLLWKTLCFLWQVQTFLRDINIQERHQEQQHVGVRYQLKIQNHRRFQWNDQYVLNLFLIFWAQEWIDWIYW
jgi:hypothetical protein